MKFINSLLTITLLYSPFIEVRGQDCRVLLSAISGKYSGDCKKGKAEGTGKSEGTDTYTGEFKAGLPDGKGTYLWANGDTFEGMWSKGQRNGQGLMSKKDGSKVSGFWEKDVYMGAFEKPYVITQQSSFITRGDIKKDKNNTKENFIQIKISNTSGGGASLLGGVFPKPDLSDILVTTGSYSEILDGLETQNSISKKLGKVIFPFKAKLTVDRQYFEFQIFEPGAWIISLELQNHTALGDK